MSSVDSVSVLSRLTLIQAIDDRLATGELYKLVPWLRAQMDVDLAALQLREAAAMDAEPGRHEKPEALQEGLARLEELVRAGYAEIASLPVATLSEEFRSAVFAFHGWAGGVVGPLTDDRIVALACLGGQEFSDLQPSWRYSEDLRDRLRVSLEAYRKLSAASSGSSVAMRSVPLEAASQTLALIHSWYGVASNQQIRNPELLVIWANQRGVDEAPAVSAEAKLATLEAKRLQRIEAEQERALTQLAAAADKVRAKAARGRTLTAVAARVRTNAKNAGEGADTNPASLSS
jgi:hypothetical protein